VETRNEASLDSELAVLAAYSRQISGFAHNPYFQRFRAVGDLENSTLVLFCRLDAPTAETLRRMFVDAISQEKVGLWRRAYVDRAESTVSGWVTGKGWFFETIGQLDKVGIRVVYDDTAALFPDAYPMTDCALYYGWYAGVVTGPFTRPDFHFVPG